MTQFESVAEAPLLTLEQLEELEARAREQEAPGVETLRPGLSSHQIDSLLGSLGIDLPDEARLWWGWHDGADTPRNLALDRQIGRLQLLPLAGAIEAYRKGRETAAQGWGERFSLEEFWPPEWFPLVRLKGEAVCDCSVAAGAPTPIRVMDPWLEPEANLEPIARSLGEAVTWWIEALESGVWRFDPDRQAWDYDWQAAGGPPRDRLV